MANVLLDNRDVFLRSFIRVKSHARRRLREAAPHIGDRLLRELQKRQPVGQPDPLVLAGFSRRPQRPSRRQGLVPIEEGWLPPQVRNTAKGAEVQIWSRSRHLKYWTRMTGRRYLGTRISRPVVARRYPHLWFWWGGPVMKRQSRPKGFRPRTDFAQDAFDATEEFVRQETGQAVGLGLRDAFRSLWTRITR